MEKYEVIDQDPEFTKVVKFFRPVDWLTWAGVTASGPLGFVLLEVYEPAAGRRFKMPAPMFLRAATVIGCTAGFILAYNQSTKRLWGITENAREVEKDRYQVKKMLSQGINPYGSDKSSLSPYLQDVSARNSTRSQLLLGFLPMFNFASHPYHGVDLKKYYEDREGEEKWGFNKLVALEKIPGLENAK